LDICFDYTAIGGDLIMGWGGKIIDLGGAE